jgi:hypothetical protein
MWRARGLLRDDAQRLLLGKKLTGCGARVCGRGYDPAAENAFADLPMVVRASSLSGSGVRVKGLGAWVVFRRWHVLPRTVSN